MIRSFSYPAGMDLALVFTVVGKKWVDWIPFLPFRETLLCLVNLRDN